mmetsp:Transcript_20920/g.67707  ORF Transcript_20920/g.67707 Transcript_20920/m.67707 type:complete len:260 (+) Transcript_20920:1423-2202(+)
MSRIDQPHRDQAANNRGEERDAARLCHSAARTQNVSGVRLSHQAALPAPARAKGGRSAADERAPDRGGVFARGHAHVGWVVLARGAASRAGRGGELVPQCASGDGASRAVQIGRRRVLLRQRNGARRLARGHHEPGKRAKGSSHAGARLSRRNHPALLRARTPAPRVPPQPLAQDAAHRGASGSSHSGGGYLVPRTRVRRHSRKRRTDQNRVQAATASARLPPRNCSGSLHRLAQARKGCERQVQARRPEAGSAQLQPP